MAQEAYDLIGLATQNQVADNPSVRPRDEVCVFIIFLLISSLILCCHRTFFHISSSVVPVSYLEGISNDTLNYNEYLVMKQGRVWDLSNARSRKLAIREILGLLRYLRKVRVSEIL